MGEEPTDPADLAAALRAEWRDEEEQATADAAAHWRHRRTLTDLLADARHRGAPVAVTVAGHEYRGTVVEVAPDLVALRTPLGRVDVHLAPTVPLALELLDEPADPGAAPAPAAGSFRGRLLTLEAAGAPVAVTTVARADPLTGTIEVGADHLGVDTRAQVIHLPITSVATVAPAPED